MSMFHCDNASYVHLTKRFSQNKLSKRPTYDEGAKECTHEMAKSHNQCLTKKEESTYLETYNCEYIKSPKPERFARAMVSCSQQDSLLLLQCIMPNPKPYLTPCTTIDLRNKSIVLAS